MQDIRKVGTKFISNSQLRSLLLAQTDVRKLDGL